MRKYIILSLLVVFQLSNAQQLPLAYKKYYEASFLPAKISEQFVFSDSVASKISKGIWSLSSNTDSSAGTNPDALVLINKHVLGDFITDVMLNLSIDSQDSLSAFYLISGYRDSANYYFIRYNAWGLNFYKMYKGEVSLIDSDSSFRFLHNSWQSLRINRSILTRTIELTNNGQFARFHDPNLIMGFIGFGLSQSRFAIKKMSIWAPTAIEKQAPELK
ncbi:MAG TPA: hypothetical protein DDX98_12380 [Bacteroidales bacterium]|jgi:hypothetical protein|nr:hypothetical protein [Bacteroidales bacterium]